MNFPAVFFGLMFANIMLAVLQLCLFAADKNPFLLVIALITTLCSASTLHAGRSAMRFNRARRIADSSLAAAQKQFDSMLPNYTAIEHHQEQCEAALEDMRKEL